ncbi:MAG: hypothetical protein ACRENX_08660 [Candidatus Dormibacteria bacterium]
MSSSEPRNGPTVGLLSQDLLVRSRVETGLSSTGARVQLIVAGELPPGLELLLVDLNRQAPERLSWLRRVAPTRSGTEVICFGAHTEMAQLSATARAAGASRCVANSHLAESLQRWARARLQPLHERGE